MRLFADEDVYNELKQLLTESGHDVVSPIELGLRGAGDEMCFLHAASDARTIITHNGKDFSLLHRAWMTWPGQWNIATQPQHSGILSVPHQNLLSPTAAANRIDWLIRTSGSLLNTFYRLERSGLWRSYF